MTEKEVDDILLFGGGIIPDQDIIKLKEMGVGELFTPGAPTSEIVQFLNDWVKVHPKV
jgi:methylmalonyl-CoA mutase C-terminal domain/subunit